MRVRFRPLIGLSIATALLFAALIGLGVWQVQRLHWKLDLIASVDRNLRAPPLSLSQALAMGVGAAQYHRVAMVGRFDNDKEAYVFATDANGDPAYHVIVPFRTDLGTFLVDRGIVSPGLRPPSTRRSGEIDRVTQVVGVWRTPDPPGLFTPAPEAVHRVWYSRDLKAIARADRISLRAPVIIEADSAPNPGGWPKGGQTQVQFRNEHLQYAVTWFALAAALLAVYFAYHRAKGRLSLG
jgi:surfeit locus 1 family protein